MSDIQLYWYIHIIYIYMFFGGKGVVFWLVDNKKLFGSNIPSLSYVICELAGHPTQWCHQKFMGLLHKPTCTCWTRWFKEYLVWIPKSQIYIYIFLQPGLGLKSQNKTPIWPSFCQKLPCQRGWLLQSFGISDKIWYIYTYVYVCVYSIFR